MKITQDSTMKKAFIPALDIFEQDDCYKIRIELPGLEKEEIDLHLENHNLVLRGERKQNINKQVKNILMHETNYGSFYRSFHLPDNVDTKQDYTAKLSKGVLSIVLPKKQIDDMEIKAISIQKE